MDVLFYEAFEEEAAALRCCMPQSINAQYTWKTVQEAGHEVPPAPVISVRTQSSIPVQWAAGLQAVLSRSTGYDHLNRWLDSVQEPVHAGYLPLYCNRAVAEHACMMWLGLLRRLPKQIRQFSEFERDGLTGCECMGKNLLVAGVGNIGYEAVRIGAGLKMDVRGVDPVRKHEDIEYVSIDEGIGWADVIVCAMNLTSANHGVFSRGLLEQAKQGCVFVNVARGELSPAGGLLSLLEAGHLGGVGLDVFNEEPALAVALRAGIAPGGGEAEAVLQLSERDDVLLTPHNAFNTRESVRRKAEQSVEQLMHLGATGKFRWSVPTA